MKILLSASAVLVAALSALSAQAEPVKLDMQAGLWENKIALDGSAVDGVQPDQMKLAMDEMKKQLANMPPEQRKQMEAMMAQSGMKMTDDGVSFNNNQVTISPAGTNAKICITQEQINRGDLPDDVKGCESVLKQISPNQFKSTHVCSGEYSGTGESEVTFLSPKHYTGKGEMTQMTNGEKRVVKFTMEGKWLANDCGDIKPTP